jgi:hypothetical protein
MAEPGPANKTFGPRSATIAYHAYPCHTYDMAERTTIVLDDRTRRAARELARRYGCTMSEAIRRAVIQQRDREIGVGDEERRRRVKALDRLFAAFEGVDPAAEVQRRKDEDADF